MSDRRKSILRAVLGTLGMTLAIFFCSAMVYFGPGLTCLSRIIEEILYYLALIALGPIGGPIAGGIGAGFFDAGLLTDVDLIPAYPVVLPLVPVIGRGLQALIVVLVTRRLVSRRWTRISSSEKGMSRGRLLFVSFIPGWALGTVLMIVTNLVLVSTCFFCFLFVQYKEQIDLMGLGHYISGTIRSMSMREAMTGYAMPQVLLYLAWAPQGILGLLAASMIVGFMPARIRDRLPSTSPT